MTINQTPYTIPEKSKTTALLLGIFPGGSGVHRFDADKIGTGILYLLTAGVFGIGWPVDLIKIIAGSFIDQYGAYLKQG